MITTMKEYNKIMKNKALLVICLALVLPVITQADESVVASSTAEITANQTAGTTILEQPQKDARKEGLRKQLSDTLNVYLATVSSIGRLGDRVTEREAILVSQGTLNDAPKKRLDLKLETLNKELAAENDAINNTLTTLAENVLNASKPARAVANFKRQANKIKTEITSSYKLIVEIINMVKQESVAGDSDTITKTEVSKDGKSTESTDATTSDQNTQSN